MHCLHRITFCALACWCVNNISCVDRIVTGTRQAGYSAPSVENTLTARSRIECLTKCTNSQYTSFNYRPNTRACELVSETNPVLNGDMFSDHVEVVTILGKSIPDHPFVFVPRTFVHQRF